MARQTGQSTTRGAIVRPGFRVQSAPAVEFDCRTAYEFVLLACGHSFEPADLLPEDRRLVEQARERLPVADAKFEKHEAIGPAAFISELCRFILPHPEIKTARNVVDAVDKMSDRELQEWVLGELLESPELSVLTRRAMDGSQAAFSELCAIVEQGKGNRPPCNSMEEIAPAVRDGVHFWLDPFESIEARVGRMTERDVASRHNALASSDPIAFVENVTNGIRLMDSRIRRIVLAPSYFGRPYNSLSQIGDTELINYPIADEALDTSDRLAPPQSIVRLHRALGDESRLRILRLLAERERYLTELAIELDLSKPTTKHHLALLRSAGLVTVTEQAGLTYYSLRRERLAEGGEELRTFLNR